MAGVTIRNRYFAWLTSLVCSDYQQRVYSRALRRLHETSFVYSIAGDHNREIDGLLLRDRFCEENGVVCSNDVFPKECSVLEMMIALAVRMEDEIMYDPELGDRSAKWFWIMMENLYLMSETNEVYEKGYVDSRIDIFLNRTYGRDGQCGGLFNVPHHRKDFRKTEIWYQMNWWLSSLDDED